MLGTVHILRNQIMDLLKPPSPSVINAQTPPLGKILRYHWLNPHPLPSDPIIKDKFIMYHDKKYHVVIFFSTKY